MTTLTHNTTTLALPADLLWEDEFAWRPVQETREYALHGALIVDRGIKLVGRPMTLAGSRDYAWVTRTAALQLHAWAQQPGLPLVLVYRSTSYQVAFDQDGPPLELTPRVDYANPAAGDWYVPVLRFYTRA
jgi:hypothetical protein